VRHSALAISHSEECPIANVRAAEQLLPPVYEELRHPGGMPTPGPGVEGAPGQTCVGMARAQKLGH